ncbi:MAG: hypothetical protein HLUCCA04_01360 [Oceanicaulis sp. HLUCCA04]|nr:MAG: hypothetical protein HLUCCA04_01360 [Oceanicaulis sp. HLUCCA04]
MGADFLVPAAAVVLSAVISALVGWWVAQRQILLAERSNHLAAADKIAGFRQAWINELREAISEFQSVATVVGDVRSDERIYRLGTKSELMMNTEDDDYLELVSCLYSYLDYKNLTIEERWQFNAPLVSVSQRILKREWERLKADLNAAAKSNRMPHSWTERGNKDALAG